MNYYAISSYSLNNSLRTPDYNRLQCRKFCIHVSAFLLHRCIDEDRTLIIKYQYIVAITKLRNQEMHYQVHALKCLKNSYRVSQKKSILLKSQIAWWITNQSGWRDNKINHIHIFGSAVSLGLDSAAVSIFGDILVELTNIETALLSTLVESYPPSPRPQAPIKNL